MMHIICDIDGVLSDLRHRRHLIEGDNKDWPAFYEAMIDDARIDPMINMVRSLQRENKIIFCTGRPGQYRRKTIDWLTAARLWYPETVDILFMRLDNDYRSGYEIKLEMLHMLRRLDISPTLAIDDDPRCVKMYRENGLICLENEWNKQ